MSGTILSLPVENAQIDARIIISKWVFLETICLKDWTTNNMQTEILLMIVNYIRLRSQIKSEISRYNSEFANLKLQIVDIIIEEWSIPQTLVLKVGQRTYANRGNF
jgi:hypothetical protein